MQGLFKLDSFIVEKIWGSKRLKELKNLDSDALIGETYEVSTHKSGNSLLKGEELSKFINLNYLIKFISTSDNLSIQVHPDDEYAKKFESDSGKTEAWLILEAAENAGIYIGFKKGVTKKEFKNAIQSGLAVQNFLNFVPVKKGEFYILPAGLVHAIGKDVTLCEVQQSSGITYRVWDWGRVDSEGNSRELHIEKALDVLNFNENFNEKYSRPQKQSIFENDFLTDLIKHSDFKTSLINIKSGKHDLKLNNGEALVILEGKPIINEEAYFTYDSLISLGENSIELTSENAFSILLTQ